MDKKTILSTGILLAVIIIGASAGYYYFFLAPKMSIAEKCEGYNPNWENFVDCFGVISITDAWDVDYISLKDHMHEYEIARVYNSNQYAYAEGKLYVMNRNTIEGQTSNGERTQYYQRLFKNGEISTDYYSSVSDIPTYLIIDTKTGEVKAYKDLTEASEAEKKYFSETE